MIKRKATGDLEDFARKNGLCKRAMTDVLTEMKELGFPIKYDRMRKTYYYDELGEMVKHLFAKEGQTPGEQVTAITGKDDDLCFSEITVFELCRNV
ncbi:hypothetical protein [Chitinophaga sp.]|uniref:hypothetical protein n=1 Tax=Chitinophaga sp. TaxID=1869181 RepID=UPI002F94CC67